MSVSRSVCLYRMYARLSKLHARLYVCLYVCMYVCTACTYCTYVHVFSVQELQDKAVYCKQFLESGIDGLHLLELTHEDMKGSPEICFCCLFNTYHFFCLNYIGLGVRHLSDRRKIATYVDGSPINHSVLFFLLELTLVVKLISI